jgi:hypothetical protein
VRDVAVLFHRIENAMIADQSGIKKLASRGWIKGGAVQPHQRPIPLGGNFLDKGVKVED